MNKISRAIFVGKKPIDLELSEERVYVKSRREVLAGVLGCCGQDSIC